MVKAGGYANKIARVDLCNHSVEYEEVCEEDARKYLGGRGLGVKYIFDNNPRVDPLSPENLHAFMVGPLTGTLTPLSGRLASVTISPLTNTITDSHVGGWIGAALKWAGFDGILVEGASYKPVYLLVKDGTVRIEDATSLWGKLTSETTDLLKKKHGKNTRVFSIGPAGEKMVRLACIMHDGKRASGRGGTGAVMGSKKLKAVVIVSNEETMPIPVDKENFMRAREAAMKKVLRSDITAPRKGGLSVYGTDVLMNIVNEIGALPTRNAKNTSFEEAYNISGEHLKESILVDTPTCHACPVACKRDSEVKEGKYAHRSEGPEYETAWALGAEIGVGNIEAVSYMNWLANEYGLDTIELGNVLGVAAEATERGLVNDGVEWGDADRFIELIHLIGKREGLGEVLAEGAYRAAIAFGDPDIAIAVKGQAIPAYDPRGLTGFAVAYATSNRGACHLRAYTPASELFGIPEKTDPLDTSSKPRIVKLLEDLFAALDSLDLCKFSSFAMTLDDYSTILSSFTGWQIDNDEFLSIGERIWNLERYINQMRGFDRRHDRLPKRMMTEEADSGPAKGNVITEELFNKLLDEYYSLRGWNADGTIPWSKLRAMGILA